MTALTELYWGIPPRSYLPTRGWTPADVDAAYARLRARGLVDGETLTPAGRDLGERAEELFALLAPWAEAIVAGGGYPVDPSRLRGSLPI